MATLSDRLYACWQRYAACFRTTTRDTSEYAYHYVSAILRMPSDRTFTSIGHTAGVASENIQHFISNAPWDAHATYRQVQREIAATPALAADGLLILDEAAVKKAGPHSAGAGRQWNGRLGKVDLSQVGTFLAFASGSTWTWIDGELFLPEHWFTPQMADERVRLGIPTERTFASKVALGWQMIERVQAIGLPFAAVACDDLYGRSHDLRAKMDQAAITYMADIPRTLEVYVTQPVIAVPAAVPGQRGPRAIKGRVVPEHKAVAVWQLARREDTHFEQVQVRATERGTINDPFAARRVWTRRDGLPVAEEWLVIRQESNGEYSYALSNAPADTPVARLAWLKCQRYAIECANQDAKSELGWDELQAQKYRAWEHHLALTILASWFVAQTKLEWNEQYGRDAGLLEQFGVEVLPALSLANVRSLLRAVLPLPQFTPHQAAQQVVRHLVNRTRSRKSRLKQRSTAPPETLSS